MARTAALGLMVIATSAMLAAQSPARYDRAAEKTYSGVIVSAASYPAPDGTVGVHLDLKTDEGIIDVRIGPAMFIGQQNFWFFAEQRVVVIGAPILRDDNRIVLAKAVQKGSDTLILRTDVGLPKWTPATDGADGCGVNHPSLQRTTER